MPDEMSVEICEQLESLCQQISVSYDLDPVIRRELYGHMEDQYLAHRSGELPLTEQDAFELVRKQFGDPVQIQALFQGVYLKEMTASLGRRMVAALVAFTGVSLINKVLCATTALFPSLFGSWCEPYSIWCFIMLQLVFLPGIMYLLLRSWKTKINRGKRVWFQVWPKEYVMLVFGTVIGVILSSIFLCSAWFPLFRFILPDDVLGQFLRGAVTLGFVIMGILWMWFCAQPPRPRSSLHWAAGGFAIMNFLPSMCVNAYFNGSMINLDHLLMTACYVFFVSFVFAEIVHLLYWGLVGLYQLLKRFRRNSDDPLRTA